MLGSDATERNSMDAHMTFFFPDTDVLVLIIANYDRLPKNTSISMASRVQQIEPLWALPGLNAFSGAYNTGRFARIGKPTWFKLFMEAEDDVIDALCTLCDDVDMSGQVVSLLHTARRASSSQAFQICVGTCSANTWQKMRSYHLPWESSNSTS